MPINLDSPVSSIMTSNIETVTPSQKIIDIKHIYEKQIFHHHIPVVDNNRLVGIVSLIDFMRKINGASLDDNEEVYHQLTVNEIMTRNPLTVNPDTSIREVVRHLAKGEFHAVLITSGDQVTGIVTTADLLNFMLEL